MIIDCISDLHGFYPALEGGDLLIIAGDLTAKDTPKEYSDFVIWLKSLKYKKKIVIAGNHDNFIQDNPRWENLIDLGFEYLCDSGTEFHGTDLEGNSRTVKIWGSPWTKKFKGMNSKCMAFTCDTEYELMDKWDLIPHGTDILITHSPAYGICDGIPIIYDGTIFHVGSLSLYNWLKYVERPLLHIFGHIHEGYGEEEHFETYENKMMKSINCSYVDEYYKPVNKVVRIEL